MKKLMVILILAMFVMGCGMPNNENMDENNNKNNETTAVEQGENKNSVSDTVNQPDATVENTKSPEAKGYVFEYNGVKIGMDMEAAPIIAALGEADSYFEAPSCAFEGLDKTYSYGSFELDTYEQNGKDYIAGIFLCDDLIETPEGVCLFETKADMIAAYGENYTEEYGMLVYEKEGSKIKFILEGDEITSIEYASTILDVE